MKRKYALPAVIIVLIIALIAWGIHRGISFDVHSFLQQIRLVAPIHLAIALGLIYAGYFFRSYRWAIFLRAHHRVGPLTLIGSQFVGFTAVGLFGRIADLSRPYLVAQKTRTPLALQVAVYTVERMFDLGAAALIFSVALALMPRDMPHHEIFVRVGVGSLAGTLLLAGFCIAMRAAGGTIAAIARRIVSILSARFGEAVEEKLLAFRQGLSAVSSMSDFVIASALSLIMWLMIATAYLQTANAFTATPSLANLTFSRTMLLVAASIGGSLLQLPVLGWFTQIATNAAAMHAFYGTPLEPATACAAAMLLITFISVIPIGLIYARIERVSLSGIAHASEAAAEEQNAETQSPAEAK